MMRKEINPNFVSAILIGFIILILEILPIQIQIVPSEASAQETPSTAELINVSETEARVIEYTLRTIIGQTPPMAYIGVGGEIDGQVNPHLNVNMGDTLRITLINGDPVLHNLHIDEFGVATADLLMQDQQEIVEFVATTPGDFIYYCSIPGHREIGMFGTLTVAGVASDGYVSVAPTVEAATEVTVAPAVADAVSIIRNPADLPAPIVDRAPTTVQVDLTAVEVDGQLADGTTYHYMTFNGQVPGPMIRVRVGDTVEVNLQNNMTSTLPHSIDLHAVTGPGGGAVYTQTLPGETTTFTFQALQPGLYVYHCATASIGHHISSGMYGMILVEPEGGLSAVDREFYMMQGEIYTTQPFGTQGHLDFSHEQMLDEDPEYLVFNGAVGALTLDEYALRANVGETVRIYFGVGGPNFTSSFHLIGEIFDRVYDQASLTALPLTDVQTTLVPSGGATIVEFTLDVPGRYILVDHALARLERGLAGYLYAEGEENPDIFHGEGDANMSGH
jgi:nitrite reductase (NO-forming)